MYVNANRVIASLCLLGSITVASAQELDQEELRQFGDVDVEFESYTGPEARIDTATQIRRIGDALGSRATSGVAAVANGSYTIRRILGDPDSAGRAADLIELGPGAGVDRIVNLRRIVSGYLERAWSYSREDADLLARFVTIYNAVQRGNLAFFEQRYRPAVAAELDAARVGLAISYREWPGATQLVVPIRADLQPGDLGVIDPIQLLDPSVIDSLRRRADLGLQDRKAIIEFAERVVEQEQLAIVAEREQVAVEREQVAAEREQVERAIERVETDPTLTEAERETQTEELETQREQLERRDRQLDRREEATTQRQREVDELSESIATAVNEAARDQRAPAEAGPTVQLLPFALRSDAGYEIAAVDVLVPELAGNQTVPVVDPAVIEFQGRLLATDARTERLVLLAPDTIDIAFESDVQVIPRARIRVVGPRILTLIEVDGSAYIGEFDAGLVLVRRSAQPVLPATDIQIGGDAILVQGENGTLRLLRLEAAR